MNKKKTMTLEKYQAFCKKTARKSDKPNEDIFIWGLGITGEAGDVASCIKKTYFHDNNQKAGIKENLGDTMWYMAMICNFYGWKLEDVLAENIKKLTKRYSKGFFTTKHAGRGGTMIDWNEK